MPGWTQDLAVGVADIDEQHQELFRRAEAFDDALAEGRLEEAPAALRFLSEYYATHMACEQLHMVRARYPDLRAHVEQHAWFGRELRTLQRDLGAGRPLDEIGMRMNELVLSWLVRHIAETDRALAGFLQAPR